MNLSFQQTNVMAVLFLTIFRLVLLESAVDAHPQQVERGTAAYERYADGLMRTYDKNKDGYFDQDELREMRRPPKNADLDGDLLISKAELIQSINPISGGQRQNSEATSAKSIPQSVSIRLDLLELDETATHGELDEQVRLLNSDSEDIEGLVELTRKIKGVVNVDSLICRTVSGETFESSGFQDAVYAQGNRHDSLQVSIQPLIRDENVLVKLNLAKAAPIKRESNSRLLAGFSATGIERLDEILELEGEITVRMSDDTGTLVIIGDPRDVARTKRFIQNLIPSDPEGNQDAQAPENQAIDAQDDMPLYKSMHVAMSMSCKFGGANAMLLSESGRRWLLIVRADRE